MAECSSPLTTVAVFNKPPVQSEEEKTANKTSKLNNTIISPGKMETDDDEVVLDAEVLVDDSSPSMDALTCTPKELANYLLSNRFANQVTETQKFLQTCLETIGGDSANSNSRSSPTPSSSEDESVDLGEFILEQTSWEVSCLQPRGKLQMTCHQEGLRLQDKKGENVVVPADFVEHVVVFPKPEDCRPKTGSRPKPTSDMILLVFKSNNSETQITFKKKPLKQICFQLPLPITNENETAESTVPRLKWKNDKDSCSVNNLDWTEQWIAVISTCLHFAMPLVSRVYAPQHDGNTPSKQFKSYQEEHVSTTTSGMPFVKSYLGVQDGVLYPMESGLLFFKPVVYYPRNALHSIACGTRGNNSGGRYIDLTIQVNDEKDPQQCNSVEFSNITKVEETVLKKYIYETLVPAMQRDLKGGNNDPQQKPSQSSMSSSEETRSDSSSGGRRSKRKASLEASMVNKRIQLSSTQHDDEEDDDDEDFGEHEEDDDDDDEDDDDDKDVDHAGVDEIICDEGNDTSEDDEDYGDAEDASATESEGEEL